jgi:hypothetical protein
MSYFRRKLRNAWRGAATLIAVGLAGCANSCFVFVSSNGSGGVFVKVSDPPRVCSLDPAKGAIRASVLRSPVCETCTSAAKIEHVFVTVRGVQLRPSAIDDTDSSEWLEVSPRLTVEPRQVDLIGESSPELLVESGTIPAGGYTKVRLQFLLDFAVNPGALPIQNACGKTQWNCIVMADGRVEPLRFPRDVPELLIPLNIDNEAVVVLPDSRMDLQLSLEPRWVLAFSTAEGLKPQSVLRGRALVVRQWQVGPPMPAMN